MSAKKLVLQVSADTRQAVAGLKEVGQGVSDLFKLQQGSGRDIASGALKAFDGLKGAMQGVMPVATAVLDIAEKGIEMAQFAGQRQILMRQVGDANLEALRAGTKGLVDDQTLLQAAAKGLRGDFALTALQMEDVAAAAVTLHNEGLGPVSDILADLTDSLSTGQTDALKKYGISLGEAGSQAEKLGRAHEAMATLAVSADNQLEDSGSSVTRMLVTLKDAWDDIKVAIGGVVDVAVQVGAAIVNATAFVGDQVLVVAADIASWGDLDEAMNTTFTTVRGVMNAQQEADEAQRKHNESIAISIDFLHRLGAEYARVSEHMRQMIGDETEAEARTRRFNQFKELNAMAQAADAQRAEDAKKYREQEDKAWLSFASSLDKVMDHRLELVKSYEEAEKHAAEMTFGMWQEVNDHITEAMQHRQEEIQNALLPLANRKAADPGIKRLQDMAKETMNAGKAWDHLKASSLASLDSIGQAAGTSLQAIISGNKGAQASMSEVFKQMLDQFGTEMQINALKYLAMGTAAVFTQPEAAGNFFAAAGIFEAAALAAGVAERAVGAPSGAGSSAGSGGGSPANQNTAGRDAATSSGGGSTTVIHQYYVNGFIGDEARLARQIEATRRRGELAGYTRPMAAGARRS